MGGTAIALPLAWLMIGPLDAFLPMNLVERAIDLTPDRRVMAATAIIGMVTGILMSALPAILATRSSVALTASPRTMTGATSRWGMAVLIAQIALATVLVVGAGLLVRSLNALQHVDSGVRSDNVLTVRLMPLPDGYAKFDHLSYYPMLLDRIRQIPAVRNVGYARMFPFLTVESPALQPVAFVDQRDAAAGAVLDVASPGFFETVGIPVIRGRAPTWQDRTNTTPVAFVNRRLAYSLAADGDVIGKYVRIGADKTRQRLEIVGVVGNATLGNLRAVDVPILYRPSLQEGRLGFYPTLAIATHGDPTAIADQVRTGIDGLGREYAHTILPLEDALQRAAVSERLTTTVALIIAGLAVLLAFVGLYGLLAYAAARRTREIGVRVAMGATRGAIVTMVLRDALSLTALGVIIGIPAAIASTRVLRSLLYDVSPSDPWTIAATAALFLLVGAVAGFLPARRAASIDPACALRAE